MKKLSFVLATMVTIFLGMTGCTVETSDVIVYWRVGFEISSSSLDQETEGLNPSELTNIFEAHMQNLGESLGENSVIIRRQNNEEKVKKSILHAAQDADAEVKEKFGDPANVQKKYSKLKIAVYYTYGGDPDVTVVTYTYKE